MVIITLALTYPERANAQNDTYRWNWRYDGPALGASASLWGGALWLQQSAKPVTEADLATLNASNIWAFDRSATRNYDLNAKRTSDYFLFGSAGIPFTLLASRNARSEALVIGGMFAQTMLLTDGTVNLLKATTKRYRPFNYNSAVPLDVQLTKDARFSFPSGHVSTTTAVSWFTARVYTDLHPNSRWKPLVWVGAAVIPATTGWLRYKAGKHFPTDVITGYAIGAAAGWLVPTLHRASNNKLSLRLLPVPKGMGFHLRYVMG